MLQYRNTEPRKRRSRSLALTPGQRRSNLCAMSRMLFTLLSFFALVLTAAARDTNWARKVEHPGLPNLHRVSDNLYRCAQPTAEGLRTAEKLGIKTVLSLRAFHSDSDEIKSTKLKAERIYFNTWHAEEEDVLRFLKVVTNTNAGPVLVHCQHGADRTGTMIAIYRMAIQGWKKEDAIKEMTEGGFGYHTVWKNLIRYLDKLDVDALREKAGLRIASSLAGREGK
jgi:protein tyrosine/serine phosphatase